MLDISQIIATFNPLMSHNVAHSCDHAALKLDCCYEILKLILLICTSTKASIKFQATHHPVTSVSWNIIRLLTWKQNTSCLPVR